MRQEVSDSSQGLTLMGLAERWIADHKEYRVLLIVADIVDLSLSFETWFRGSTIAYALIRSENDNGIFS